MKTDSSISGDCPEYQREKQIMLDKALRAVSEHFDSIQIVATCHSLETNRTTTYEAGIGSLFNRLGSVQMWSTCVAQAQLTVGVNRLLTGGPSA